jgi:D-sedoheptulose 7-phosphate isomerase
MSINNSVRYIELLNETLSKFPHNSFDEITSKIILFSNTERNIFICGNGGSASTASHFVVDINKGSRINNNSFRAICLNDNIPSLTAIANDLSYDLVFSNQLIYLAKRNDLLIVVTASGNSPNILEALKTANHLGLETISITGFDGGQAKKISNLNLNVESDHMQIIEDTHLVVVHMILNEIIKKNSL